MVARLAYLLAASFASERFLVGESKVSAMVVCREQAFSSRMGIASRSRWTLEDALTRSLCAHDVADVRSR